jgi:outer membrane immunogenic protein
MKNLILSITVASIAIILSASNTYAQNSKTKVGIKAGVSLTTLGTATSYGNGFIYYDYTPGFQGSGVSINYNYRPGFQGGVFLETPLSSTVLFSPQVLFTQKGGNLSTVISGAKITGSTQVNYIDVPLLVGFKANPNLVFYVGPQVAFLISKKDAYTSGGSTITSTSTTGARSTILGGNVGAGYKFSANVGLNVNYIFDFSNAAKKAYDNGEKNSGFIFTLGYSF